MFGEEVSSGRTGGGFVSMTSSKAMICTQTQTMIRWQVAGQVSRSCTEVRTGAEAMICIQTQTEVRTGAEALSR